MNRTTQIRLERLEEAHLQSATPHRVLSSCPLPDEPASHAVIAEWLDEGLAHVAFGGRAVFYDGGQHGVLGLDEWRAAYCNGATPKSLLHKPAFSCRRSPKGSPGPNFAVV